MANFVEENKETLNNSDFFSDNFVEKTDKPETPSGSGSTSPPPSVRNIKNDQPNKNEQPVDKVSGTAADTDISRQPPKTNQQVQKEENTKWSKLLREAREGNFSNVPMLSQEEIDKLSEQNKQRYTKIEDHRKFYNKKNEREGKEQQLENAKKGNFGDFRVLSEEEIKNLSKENRIQYERMLNIKRTDEIKRADKGDFEGFQLLSEEDYKNLNDSEKRHYDRMRNKKYNNDEKKALKEGNFGDFKILSDEEIKNLTGRDKAHYLAMASLKRSRDLKDAKKGDFSNFKELTEEEVSKLSKYDQSSYKELLRIKQAKEKKDKEKQAKEEKKAAANKRSTPENKSDTNRPTNLQPKPTNKSDRPSSQPRVEAPPPVAVGIKSTVKQESSAPVGRSPRPKRVDTLQANYKNKPIWRQRFG